MQGRLQNCSSSLISLLFLCFILAVVCCPYAPLPSCDTQASVHASRPPSASWHAAAKVLPTHLNQAANSCTADIRCFALVQVADTFTLTPPKIERHFGITGGHIHHIDNCFGFDQRFPCATPVPGLYSASAGARPACNQTPWLLFIWRVSKCW